VFHWGKSALREFCCRERKRLRTDHPFFAALPVLILSGCAGNTHRPAGRALNWEAEPKTSIVATSPAPTLHPVTTPTLSPAPLPQKTAVPAAEFHETWVPLARWCKANNLAQPNQLGAIPLPTYALNAPNGALVLRGGSRIANWNGLELRLGFAPQMIDNQIFVNALDIKKSVEPLLSAGTIFPAKTNRVIVIDAGHGGQDAGAKSILGNRYEKEFTLDWARRLASLLSAKGWQVYLTRANDTELALSNRVTVAEQRKADLFVSLHFNSAAPDTEQAGLETYCLTPTGMPSTLTRGFEDDLRLAFPNNSFDGQNLQLACGVHRALLRVNGNHDRGVRRARFPAVLRGQQRPAILIEGGYLSNPREARLISDPVYRQKLAQAVANGIEETAPGEHEIAVDADDSGQRSEVSPETLRAAGQRTVAR
jgi:N-acetylmuramoyl-L-alanine amidase